jgi:prepilin-type N-terminal cleavage/methylation domain-containing protein
MKHHAMMENKKRVGERIVTARRAERDLSRGFTLIEILITMAIIGIASSVIIVGLGSGRTERELEAAAREFASTVREAQNYALTGRQITPGTDPCQYQTSWSGSQYVLTYFANVGGACSNNATFATFGLKGGVTFTSAGSVSYRPPHATNDIVGSRLVVFTKNSRFHSVCLYKNGRIFDQVGQLNTCP